MTPKEINDLKIKFNAMQEDGRVKYDELLKISKSMKGITDTLIEVEGDDYDGIPLIFGAGYWIDEGLIAKDALDHVPDAGKMVGQGAHGCTHCSHPMYAGTKCKNCGRVTDNDDTALLRRALAALYNSTPVLGDYRDGSAEARQKHIAAITALRERLGEKV